MDDTHFNKIITTVILIALLVLSFFLLKPILISVIFGVVLAFIFSPVYCWLYKKTKSKNFSAALICIVLILIIVIPLWFLTPIIIKQSIRIYMDSQKIDFTIFLKKIFPSYFASEEFSAEVGSALHSFVIKMTNSLMNSLGDLITNFATLMMQFLVAIFIFFFAMRDKDALISYIRSLLPFSKSVEDKLFESSKSITFSVIYGQVVVGILQGVIAGIGFFIFGVPNSLVLTLIACVAGILPFLGPFIVWVPVVVYLFVVGDDFSGFGVMIFGVIASTLDNFLRPMIISRRTHIHSSIILVGMVGGLFMFGVIGFILGPLILSYLLIILEIYRGNKSPGILIQPPKAS